MSHLIWHPSIRVLWTGAFAVAHVALMCLVGAAAPVDAGAINSVSTQEPALIPIEQPMLAVVSLRDQVITVYDANGQILRAPVSSGQPGYETPVGIYSVIQKEAEHTSNLYDDASMPFMQRITWSGIALHAGALPGYPASHGCVRMPHAFAERVFGLTRLGMKVLVSRHDLIPVAITHPALFQPSDRIEETLAASASTDPPGQGDKEPMRSGPSPTLTEAPQVSAAMKRIEALKALADKARADIDSAARAAEAARLTAHELALVAIRSKLGVQHAQGAKVRSEAQLRAALHALESTLSPATMKMANAAAEKARAKIAEAQALIDGGPDGAQLKVDAAARAAEEARTADEARIAAIVAARVIFRRMKPISVFISRKQQRLYVRQAFEPVFDIPVVIREAEKPIGTHIYLAVAYSNETAPVRWTAVSFAKGGDTFGSGIRKKQNFVPRSEQLHEALDRIEITKEARELISDVVALGSSLIISDEDMSTETSTGTDFVIIDSDEPQGGIKMRRRGTDELAHSDRTVDRARSRFLRRRPYDDSPFSWW